MRKPQTTGRRSLSALLSRFRRDGEGATALEYGILMMMIGVALLGLSTLTNVANKENATFNAISDSLK